MCNVGPQGAQGEVTQMVAVAVENLLVKDGDMLIVDGGRAMPLINLQRTQRGWAELESAVKRACAPKPDGNGGFGPRRKLTPADVETCENIVLGEGSAAQNGWRECKQALEQAGLI